MTDNYSSIKHNILTLIKNHDYDALESEWLNYIETGDYDSGFLYQIAHLLASNNKSSLLSELLDMLIQEYSNRNIHDGVIFVGELMFDKKIFKPASREILINSIKVKNQSNILLDKYLLYSELETAVDFEKGFRKINEYFFYDIGEVFFHATWKVGVVKNLDFVKNQIQLDFGKEGIKSLSFTGAREFLTKLPQDHYWILLKKEPAKLKDMIENNPVELIKSILRQHDNSLGINELKKILLSGFINEAVWNKWWMNTRLAIKKDSFFEYDETGKGMIRLRSTPQSAKPQSFDKFEKAANPQEIMGIILGYSETRKIQGDNSDTPRLMADSIIAKYQNINEEKIVLKLQYYFAYEYLKKCIKGEYPAFPESIAELLSKASDPIDIIFSFSNSDYQKIIMDAWLQDSPEKWLESIDKLLMKISPKLFETLIKQLKSENSKEIISHYIKKIMALRYHNPELYMWALSQIVKGKYQINNYSSYDMVIDITGWMENLTRDILPIPLDKKAKSNALSKARKLIEADEYWLLRNAVIDIPLDDVRHLLDTFHSAISLNDNFKSSVEYALTNSRPDLFKKEQRSGETVDTTATHYCTLKMYEVKKQEYQRIMTMEIPENSKEIAIARAHGDLRENAEYQSAKQKQKVLMNQADELRDLLERARPIDPGQISDERIAFGTHTTVMNQTTGHEEIYTILGIWEAEPSKNIISYLSPLGKSLLSKKPGDIFNITLPEGEVTYQIKTIKKVI